MKHLLKTLTASGLTAIFLTACQTKSAKLTTSYKAYEIKKFERCEPIPAELLSIDRAPGFTSAPKKNRDLFERYQKAAEYAVQERSLRLQLIGAVKLREASSGRKAAEYAAIEEAIRAEISELEKIEAKNDGLISRLNPFD